MTQAKVQGVASNKFEGVRNQFQTHLDTGADIGASFCVTKDGEAAEHRTCDEPGTNKNLSELPLLKFLYHIHKVDDHQEWIQKHK